MGTKVQKQYLEVCGKPVLYYALAAFEASDLIDDIILVVGEGQQEYCREQIVEKYRFAKVDLITPGGSERYESVYRALQKVDTDARKIPNRDGYVFIHDGARPFVDEQIIRRAYEAVREYGACVVGMPSKDTIKVVDEEGFAKETPDRKSLWQVQTPQAFEVQLIKEAYRRPAECGATHATDDAMVAEQMLGTKVKAGRGSL